jgi:hypothetical protein
MLVGLVWGTVSVGAVFAPAGRAALKAAVGTCTWSNSAQAFTCTGCLGETMRYTPTGNVLLGSDGSCPVLAASNDATGNPYGVIGTWDVSLMTDLASGTYYIFSSTVEYLYLFLQPHFFFLK